MLDCRSQRKMQKSTHHVAVKLSHHEKIEEVKKSTMCRLAARTHSAFVKKLSVVFLQKLTHL
jgi:hypothetical protein